MEISVFYFPWYLLTSHRCMDINLKPVINKYHKYIYSKELRIHNQYSVKSVMPIHPTVK